MAKTFIALGDLHAPRHNEMAVEIATAVIEDVQPDCLVTLGDMLDCSQFSSHDPTPHELESDYASDLDYVSGLLDRWQDSCGWLAFIEGNHEFRVDRWAAKTAEGRGAYSMLAPRLQLSRDRKNFTYIPYGSANGKYPHYKLNSRIRCIHGWSYAQHATKAHLRMSQGKSIIHGHTHRADMSMIQNIWQEGGFIQAVSAGCLMKPIPTYGVGSPVDWVNAFIIGYMGRSSDTIYTIPITNTGCVLPDGTEFTLAV